MTDINHVTTHTSWRERTASGTPLPLAVYVDGEQLDLQASLDVWNHSPDGFSWGYAGSGPAQLALAILLRFTDRDNAARLHQSFKFDHVAHWPQDQPLDQHVDVRHWLAAHPAEPVEEPF
jgi:hypothetical protein